VRGHGLITAFHNPPATSFFCQEITRKRSGTKLAAGRPKVADLDALGE
jgi:hypothetical protein